MDFLGIGIGLPQLLLILLVAMLVLGPERLPEVARQLARAVRTVRSYATDVQSQFEGEIGGIREEFLGIQRDITSIQGNFRGGLAELDSSIRLVHEEVRTVATIPSLTTASSGSVTTDNGTASDGAVIPPTPVVPEYAPKAPVVRLVPAPPAPEPAVTTDGESRVPDYRPRT